MKILLGNFAGLGSNLIKFLDWCLIFENNNSSIQTYILMFYANKNLLGPYGSWNNQDMNVLPFKNISNDISTNIFYKYYKIPEGLTNDDIINHDLFFMKHPFLLEDYKYKYPIEIDEMFNWSGKYKTKKILPLINTLEFTKIRYIYNNIFVKYLQPTPELQTAISYDGEIIKNLQNTGNTVLCVMIRSRHHFNKRLANRNNYIELIIEEIDEYMKTYDYILPITQVDKYYNLLLQRYGDKCIKINRKLIPEDVEWLTDVNDQEFDNETKYAIIDIHLASMCDHVIGSESNMFYLAAYLNPTNKISTFKLLEDILTIDTPDA